MSDEAINLYIAGSSIPEVSQITGISLSSVRRILKKTGKLRSRADGIRLAATKGKIGRLGQKRAPFSDAHRAALSVSRLKWGDENARGVRITSQGYVEYTRGTHKAELVHVVLVEKLFGHPMPAKEIVHHIDWNKQNNKPHNLAPLHTSTHARLHRTTKRPEMDPCLI